MGFGSREPSFNPSELVSKQISLSGSFVSSINDYWDIVKFVRHQQLPLERMITHRMGLDAAEEGFRLADRGEAGKVMFVWS